MFSSFEFRTDVEMAAERAYARAARGSNGYWRTDEIHYQPACMPVSFLLEKELKTLGHHVKQVARYGYADRAYDLTGEPIPGTSQDRGYHKYLRVAKTIPPLLIDATWQQFLDQEARDPALPKVLIGTPKEVIETLRDCGLTRPGMLEMWVPDPSKEFWHLGESFKPAA